MKEFFSKFYQGLSYISAFCYRAWCWLYNNSVNLLKKILPTNYVIRLSADRFQKHSLIDIQIHGLLEQKFGPKVSNRSSSKSDDQDSFEKFENSIIEQNAGEICIPHLVFRAFLAAKLYSYPSFSSTEIIEILKRGYDLSLEYGYSGYQGTSLGRLDLCKDIYNNMNKIQKNYEQFLIVLFEKSKSDLSKIPEEAFNFPDFENLCTHIMYHFKSKKCSRRRSLSR